jgi:hypothetical protein
MQDEYKIIPKNIKQAFPRQYRTTCDLPDGQCCPPYFDDGVPWRAVLRAGGYTIWSRPLSGSASVEAWRAALEDCSPAPTTATRK